MSPSGLNYTLKSATKALCCFTQGFLGYLRPCLFKRTLEGLTDRWEEAQASASKRDQTRKSIRLRSGDEGGQTSLLQNPGKWSWHHFCVFLDVCDGAPFCWKMIGLSFEVLFSCLKCRSQDCFNVRICIHFCSLWNKKWWGTSMFLKWRPTPWQKKVSVAWKRFSWSQECLQRTSLGLCCFVGCRLPR